MAPHDDDLEGGERKIEARLLRHDRDTPGELLARQAAMSSPATLTLPVKPLNTPEMARTRVLLPAPFGPSRPTTLPAKA